LPYYAHSSYWPADLAILLTIVAAIAYRLNQRTTQQDIIIEMCPLRSHRKSYALVLQFQDGRKIDMQRSSLADEDNHPPQSPRQLQTYLKQLYGLS
jgi:hypothetical protein